MNYPEIREIYKKSALEFVKGWNADLTEHQIDTMISVMLHRDKIMMGGSFVEAVANNDLYGAISKADGDNIKNLKLLTLCHRNNNIYPIPNLDK
jgi:hypothetical protein